MKSWWDFGEGMGHIGSGLSPHSIKCAFCNVVGEFKVAEDKIKSNQSSGKTLHYMTLICENCGNYSFAFWSASTSAGHHGLYNYLTLPYPLGEVMAPEHWPDDVQRYWRQAHSSLRHGSNALDSLNSLSHPKLILNPLRKAVQD